MVCDMVSFYRELFEPHPSPKLEDHPLSAVRDCFQYTRNYPHIVGRDSSVGIATRYGLAVRGSNPG